MRACGTDLLARGRELQEGRFIAGVSGGAAGHQGREGRGAVLPVRMHVHRVGACAGEGRGATGRLDHDFGHGSLRNRIVGCKGRMRELEGGAVEREGEAPNNEF